MTPDQDPLSWQALGQKLKKFDDTAAGADKEEPAPQSKAYKIVAEIVFTPVAAMLIGYGLDEWFATTPALFLVFLGLGLVTAVYNLIRAAKNEEAAAEFENEVKKEES